MGDIIVVNTCIPLSLSRVLADSQFTVIKGVVGFAWGVIAYIVLTALVLPSRLRMPIAKQWTACHLDKHAYSDTQICLSKNWPRLRRKAGDGCPILTDIQSSTRQASDSDRVVTLRNMLQVGALTESI